MTTKLTQPSSRHPQDSALQGPLAIRQLLRAVRLQTSKLRRGSKCTENQSLAAEPKLHTWRKNQRTKPVPRRRISVSGLSAQGPFRLKTNMAKQLPPSSVLSQEADGKRNKTHKAQALRQAGYAVGTVPLVMANVKGAKPSAINRAATRVCSVFKMFMERSLDATSAQREHPCTEVWCILARVTHTDSPHLGQTPRH